MKTLHRILFLAIVGLLICGLQAKGQTLPQFGHVVIVALENNGYSSVAAVPACPTSIHSSRNTAWRPITMPTRTLRSAITYLDHRTNPDQRRQQDAVELPGLTGQHRPRD